MQIDFPKIIQENKTDIHFITNEELNKVIKSEDTFIVTDTYIMKEFKYIFKGLENRTIIIDECNYNKNFTTFEYICKELIKLNANKNAHLYGIGGGTITDLAGFVASVYMRGIKVSFVPTTFLSMIDAAIGGKNAINVGTIKNAIGTIYQPSNVYIGTFFLNTHSHNVIIDGFAEALKIGLLFDIQLINDCSRYFDNDDITKLNTIILSCTKHKMKIVTKDTMDTNNRAFLNFGHTIGNILELEYELTHSKAIAIGMIYESQIAVLLGLIDISIYNEIYRIITKYFGYNIEKFDMVKAADKVLLDKKVNKNKIRIPVVVEIGRSKLMEINLNDFINCIKMNFNLTPKK
jgi:3-dehydroquinate synthase